MCDLVGKKITKNQIICEKELFFNFLNEKGIKQNSIYHLNIDKEFLREN